MTRSTARRLTHATLGALLVAGSVVGVVVLVQQGIDTADKIASVGSLIAAALGLGIGVWQLFIARRPPGNPGTGHTVTTHGSVGNLIVGDGNSITTTNGPPGADDPVPTP